MFELKSLHKEAVPAALEKAKHYRLLNEPGESESICLDVLAVEPDNQKAIVLLLLAMTDRFGKGYAVSTTRVQEVLGRLRDDYERCYYAGIVRERNGKYQLTNAEAQRALRNAKKVNLLSFTLRSSAPSAPLRCVS